MVETRVMVLEQGMVETMEIEIVDMKWVLMPVLVETRLVMVQEQYTMPVAERVETTILNAVVPIFSMKLCY